MTRAALLLPLLLAAAAPPAPASREPLAPASVVANVAIDQKLGARVPLDLPFRDETGAAVRLSDFVSHKPVVLSLVYYRCPGLCTMTLNGMSRAFKPLKFSAGDEFTVVTVSIDPKETHALAAEKKAEYVKAYGRAGAAEGWHFLTGDETPIRALAEAVGFRYVYDPDTDQYAHSAGIMVLTPDGRVARYYYGLEYSSRDLRWGLVEAAEGRIGSLVDAVNLLCFAYDPTTGRYGVPIMRAVRAGAVLTMAALGGFIFLMLRRERHAAKLRGGGGPPAPATPPPAGGHAT